MPNAMKGSKFIYDHPEARAQDLMDTFRDKSIKGIFCSKELLLSNLQQNKKFINNSINKLEMRNFL